MPDQAVPTLSISIDRQQLSTVCSSHEVETLDIFGSSTTGDFDPSRSDIDLIVAFKNEGVHGFADRYLNLLTALEIFFGRHVDLLTSQPIANPYLRQQVEQQRQRLFIASIP